MTNPTPDQEKFQHFKTQLRAESLGLVEDALNRGEITQSDYERYRERELHRYAHTVGSFAQHSNISLLPQPPVSLEALNQEEILILAYSEPILAHWVYQWRDKLITWEQANYGIILTLLSQVNFLRDRYTEIIEKHPMGVWLQPNDYTVIIKKDEWEKSMGVERNGSTPSFGDMYCLGCSIYFWKDTSSESLPHKTRLQERDRDAFDE